MSKRNDVILVISDMHAPWHHPDTVAFLAGIKTKYKPTRVISSGDEVDFAAVSYHEHDPDLPGPATELEMAIESLQPIMKMFPEMDILESNHGSLVYRKGITAGLPAAVLRSYNEILQAPKGWKWHFDMVVELPTGVNCYFHHSKGPDVKKNSQAMGMSFVQGHHHESFEIRYWGNPNALLFGMTVGCLVNPRAIAMRYNKNNLRRPVIGCGIIIDGLPKLLPMVLNNKGRWIGVVP